MRDLQPEPPWFNFCHSYKGSSRAGRSEIGPYRGDGWLDFLKRLQLGQHAVGDWREFFPFDARLSAGVELREHPSDQALDSRVVLRQLDSAVLLEKKDYAGCARVFGE